MDRQLKYFENYATIKDADNGVISAIASSGSIDRDNEIIEPGAFAKSLDRFVEYGTILACHQHRLPDGSPPMIGKPTKAVYDGDVLHIDFELGKGELAQKWKTAKEDGTWRAVSVGFISQKGKYDEQKIYRHEQAELLELSAVPVGSNRDAVIRGLIPDDMAERFNGLEKLIKELSQSLDSVKSGIADELREYIEDLVLPDKGDYAKELLGVTEVDDGTASSQVVIDSIIKQLQTLGV